ncbi:MAG: phosphate butyryltransferase [Gammaproteobacteria bacterium]|nr:phosphate butyryltransferase [Gammaproteobacteria bacterium]
MNALQSFERMVAAARERGPVSVAVAAAQDAAIVEAIRIATDLGLVRSLLFGAAQQIRPLLQQAGLARGVELIDEADADRAARLAVEAVHHGRAQVLVKGQINSSNFLRAALNAECGLRSGGILSHLAAFEIPGQKKLAFHTDGGMVVAPTLAEKRAILLNALAALRCIGIARPKVAVLAANEQVSASMPATLDAAALVEQWQGGEFPDCVVEGPIAMDVAASAEAAAHKGIASAISGDVDLFLLPNIECGNMVGKTLMFYAGAKMAGVILGATRPIVLVSRADNALAKVNSIALACLLSAG